MLRVPFRVGVVSVFGAWLSTLGACGRTLPGVEDTYGDDDIYGAGTGGARAGSSARGGSGAVSTGGSNRGGTSSSVGGSSVGEGGSTIGAGGSGVGGSNRGGSSFGGSTNGEGGSVLRGGTGGDVAAGGTAGDIIITVGGTGNVPGVGGTSTAGGGGMATAGGNGGTGAAAGTSSMPPGGIQCGDSVCDPADTVCCSRRSQPSYCTYPGSDCQGAMLGCSGPSTCAAGEVCCFHFLTSVCSSTCDVSVGAPGTPPTIILCDSTADCGPNQTCVVAPRGIAYCGDNL